MSQSNNPLHEAIGAFSIGGDADLLPRLSQNRVRFETQEGIALRVVQVVHPRNIRAETGNHPCVVLAATRSRRMAQPMDRKQLAGVMKMVILREGGENDRNKMFLRQLYLRQCATRRGCDVVVVAPYPKEVWYAQTI